MKIDIETEKHLKKTNEDYISKIKDRIEKYNLLDDIESIKSCFKEKRGEVINTFHGGKGEEYRTVIALGLLKGYIPHWDLICNNHTSYFRIEAKKLLYVVCSRAKENLFLFGENYKCQVNIVTF